MKKVLQLLTLTTLLATSLSAVSSESIHQAVRAGDFVEVERLINEDPTCVNARVAITGWIPLHVAASNGSTEIVKLLLARGASVNVKDLGGCTPLHCAAWGDHAEVVGFLLARGANADLRDCIKQTPLDYARTFNYTEVVELFHLYSLMQSLRKFSASELVTVR